MNLAASSRVAQVKRGFEWRIYDERVQDDDALAEEAQSVAGIVSARLSRPKENTHVLYLPPGMGRIAFGGRLVRASQ